MEVEPTGFADISRQIEEGEVEVSRGELPVAGQSEGLGDDCMNVLRGRFGPWPFTVRINRALYAA